jgi:hypothetical protein
MQWLRFCMFATNTNAAMKQLLFFFFVNLSALAQNESISVVSAEKLNVVYRGISNPIKIAVPGAKSFTVTADGFNTIEKKDDFGNYILKAGAGKEVKIHIEAQMQDGSDLHEEKVFRIYQLATPSATINGTEGFIQLTKEQLINAEVEFEMKDFLFDVDFNVYSFTIFLPKGQHINIEGNKLNEQAVKEVKKLKNKQQVIIDNIRYIKNPDPTVNHRRVAPIVVEIKNK